MAPPFSDSDAQAVEWKDHYAKTKDSSNPNDYINHPAFYAIVAMGREHAVPLVMVEYDQDVGGWSTE
jgi:hypothetical protein